MLRFGTRALSVACLMVSASALGSASQVQPLVKRLEGNTDYRARVQAALALGRSDDEAARAPLEKALRKDDRAAVRAAAALALGSLGDQQAVDALEEGLDDASLTVRTQAAEALAMLRGDDEARGKASILIQLGSLYNSSDDGSPVLGKALRRASRTGLTALSGVRMVWQPPKETKAKVPLVRVSGFLKRLRTSESDGDVVCEADVEYVLQRMPGKVIAAIVSGNAKGTVAASLKSDPKRMQQLRRDVVEAAVASAIKRTPEALTRVAAQ